MGENEISTDIGALVKDRYRYLADVPRHEECSVGVVELAPVADGHLDVGSEFAASETIPMRFA